MNLFLTSMFAIGLPAMIYIKLELSGQKEQLFRKIKLFMASLNI
jgi:hypothetical protein